MIFRNCCRTFHSKTITHTRTCLGRAALPASHVMTTATSMMTATVVIATIMTATAMTATVMPTAHGSRSDPEKDSREPVAKTG